MSSVHRSREDDVIARGHAALRDFTHRANTASEAESRRLLVTLERTLPAHFAIEEQPGGALDRLVEKNVSSEIVDGLRLDHRRFLEALVELRRSADLGGDVAAALRVLAADLGTHERVETRYGAEREP